MFHSLRGAAHSRLPADVSVSLSVVSFRALTSKSQDSGCLQPFLTSMKQEVTRKHKSDGWALDDVIYHTEVTDFERAESVRSPPKEGVYVSGLLLDGAAWTRLEGSLVESEPKKLNSLLPVLWVTGTTAALRKEKIKSGIYGPNGPYMCPMYKYPVRTDRFYISMVSLASKATGSLKSAPSSNHWVLRGVALTCTTDFA